MFKKLLIIFTFFSFSSYASQGRNLTIFAEPNIALPLTKIARQYSRISNVIVSVNFNSPDNLIHNIDVGEPADLYISAHLKWIENLHQKGVVDIYNVGYIAQDKLVLITNKDNDFLYPDLVNFDKNLIEALNILNENKATIIIDEENNSAGLFARNLINKINANDLKVFSRLAEDRTSVLSSIKNNKNNYALLLKSQVFDKKDFKIIAQSNEKPVFYQALVIAGDNMEVAREFLRFVRSEQSKKYLASHGFITN
jgi:molybdate transport system substrate-binding protein